MVACRLRRAFDLLMDYTHVDIRFPVGGLVKRHGYQSQPPNTTADCLNVLPDDTSEGRERGGTRPGLADLKGWTSWGSGEMQFMRAANAPDPSAPDVEDAYKRLLVMVKGGTVYVREANGTLRSSGSTGLGVSTGSISGTQYGKYFLFAVFDDSHGDTYNCHYYMMDLTASTVNLTEWKQGVDVHEIPDDCTLVCTWNNRAVLSGNPDYPHEWYMSSALGTGDSVGERAFEDWETGTLLSTSAVTGSEFQNGEIGEPIVALIPHSNTRLIFGTTDGMYVLEGDPVSSGGYIATLSDTVGPISNTAWCHTPSGETVMLTRDGLYKLSADSRSRPQSLSRERLPEELLNIDLDTYRASLAYDVALRAVHIWVSPANGSTKNTHYLLDWETGGFWPVELGQNSYQPTACCDFSPIAEEGKSSVVLGSYDGEIRRFDRSATKDDTYDFDSHVLLGPIPIGRMDEAGIVAESNLISEEIVGDHKYTVYAGDNAKLATTGQRSFEVATNSSRAYPRLAGQSAAIKVENDSSESSWAMEGVTIRTAPAGRIRR